jgi:hypothetical protein
MNPKLSKVIALVLVYCQVAAMLPALELRTDLQRGMTRLEHYLDRATAERRTQNWEQLAQSGLEAAMYEWESGALWLWEQDAEAWQKEREWAEANYRKEMELAYVRWASERVYTERSGLEGTGLEAALREAAELWSYREQTVDPADAQSARAAWEQVAAEIVDRYLNGWEEQQGAIYTELASRFRDLGLSDEEKEALIRETGETRRLEIGREYNRIALAEGNRLMTELLYDQGSMKKLAANEAASVIARELAREAEEAADERTRELFNQLDTMISAEAQGDIELDAEDWLNQFRRVFEEALARWEEAELGFLAARSEWEHDAEDAYLAGEEAWNQAYLELDKRQKAWEAAILSKLDGGFAAWQENQSRLAAELEDARTEFLAAASESRKLRENMMDSQGTIYIRSRQMMDLINQGIENWFGFWDEKYLTVYTQIKNAVERDEDLKERFADLDYEVFRNLLTAIDIDTLTDPNKENADTLRDQVELWLEARTVLYETETLTLNDELAASADSLINEDTGWLSLAQRYRKFADDSARRLYELAGSTVENSSDYRGELTGELLKAEALLNYWDGELEVASALHQYAQETRSIIEDAEKTREELEKAKAAYAESAAEYQIIAEFIDQKSMALNKAQDDFEKVQAVLAGYKNEIEEAQRDYLNVIAAMKDMNPALVYVELTELAKLILNFWEGILQNETGEQRSITDTIHAYYRLSHEYTDILRTLEINSLVASLETGSGLGQDGIAELEEKAEKARFLSLAEKEEDLRAAAGLYPTELLLTHTWGADTEGETRSWEGKEFLIELDLAYRETENAEEHEELLALMHWVWEEAASYYDEEVTLRKDTIEYLKTGILPDYGEEGSEQANLIRERYGQYDAELRNRQNREAGERVAQLIAFLKEGLDTPEGEQESEAESEEEEEGAAEADEKPDTSEEAEALEYVAKLREAGKGLNESGQEALEAFIALFLEYAAVRDYENGFDSPPDRESGEQGYQEALASYTAYESWRYGIYDAAGLEEITASAEFGALADEDREQFLSYVESGDTLSIYTFVEGIRTAALEELTRRVDALNYSYHYLGEKEESRFSWLSALAGHRDRMAEIGIDDVSLTALEPLFASTAKESYLKGLEQKMYRVGVWFDTIDEWDQTQYREDADEVIAKSARTALEAGWQEYQSDITTDSLLYLMMYDGLEKLRYINEGAATLNILKAEKEEALAQAQKKYNDYTSNEYEAAILAIDQSCADYNAAVDMADAYYTAMTEARLQLRKRQEIYDWAESVYLKDFGINYDESYVTPQEKLAQARYARERALIAVEVLREIISGVPTRVDATYSQALESYKESRRAYYVAQVVAYESAKSIAKQEAIVREAELAEEAARRRLVDASTSVSIGYYELVNLVDDGNGGYKPVLTYSLQQSGAAHQVVRKPDSEINGDAFQRYFGDTKAVSVEKLNGTATMTMAEWGAGEWLKRMGSRGIGYLNDVALASLYIRYCSPEGSAEANVWLKSESDPRPNGDYHLGDIPISTSFHGFNIKSNYDEARRVVLQEAYNRVIQQNGGEDDIAYYLLYRNRNIVAGDFALEEELLKSRAIQILSDSLGATHEKFAVDVRTYTGLAIGFTAIGTTLSLLSFFMPGLAVQAFMAAAAFYTMAGTAEFARKQINSLWNDVKNLGVQYMAIANGANGKFHSEYGAWAAATAYLKAEKETLNLLYYGSAQGVNAGEEKAPLAYDNFRVGLTNIFKIMDDSVVTLDEAIALYDKSLYDQSKAETGSTVIGAISILNTALDEKANIRQGLMDGEIGRLKGEQQGALGLYAETMNTALSIPAERQAELRTLALMAGDPGLDIAERRRASAEYERLIAELCLSTEDLRGEMGALLERAFGDDTWNSSQHMQNIINLEGELFGSLTRYSRPAEAYTEHEILLLREAGLAALDTDTELRLSVKEREWGIIFDDFLNQYRAWQEQVSQIRQAGLSEWNRARSRMNEGYNNWRKNFYDEYQTKTAAWDLNYLEFVNEKQSWVEDQYLYAVNVGNSGLFEYATGETNGNANGKANGFADQVIEQALAKLSVDRMNRGTIDPASYTDMLVADSVLADLLARADNLGSRTDLGTQKIRAAVKRTSGAGDLAQAAKLVGEMNNDMQKAAAKLAAQQAQQLIEEAIEQLYDRLDAENGAMLEWEERLVQSYGYRIDGQIRRQAVVDSALFENYTVTQTVHRYEFYVPESGPSVGVDLSTTALKDLDTDTIMQMVETARWNLDKWGETIFGRMAGGGALSTHIGDDPVLKDEVSYLHSPLEDAADPGSGERGKIMLDFLWNGRVSKTGYYEMSKAAYDQKFWAEVYTPGFTAPTIRSTLDLAMNITAMALSEVISPFAASFLTMIDDLIFASLDLGFNYRSTNDVIKDLTITAASSALSMGFSALANTGSVKSIATSISKIKGGNTILKAGSSAIKSYTNSMAVNAIRSFDFETGDFNTEAFTQSLYSAQTLSGTVSTIASIGFGDIMGSAVSAQNQKLLGGITSLGVAGVTEASRYGVYALDSMINGTGSLGERLEQAYGNMGGITLNIANLGSILDFMGTAAYRLNEDYSTNLGALGQQFADAGLLELNLGLDGPSLSVGSGGIDLAGNLYSTAKHGLDYLSLKYGTYGASKDRELLISHYLDGDWAAENTSMRIQAGSDILQVLEPGSLEEGAKGHTVRQDDKTGRLISIEDTGDTNLNAIVLQHESHRDGYETDDNSAETLRAVLAHTAMAARMMDNGVELPADEQLVKDLLVYRVTGGNTEAFAKYVSENYDSSGDYWRIIKDKGGKVVKVLDDGEYTTATIVEADGSEKSTNFQVGGSLSGALANLVGNGMTQQEMNAIMVESGLGYDPAKGGWYVKEEKARYIPDPVEAVVEDVEPSIPLQVISEVDVPDVPTTQNVKPNFLQSVGTWISQRGQDIRGFFGGIFNGIKNFFTKKTDSAQPQESPVETIVNPVAEVAASVAPEQIVEQVVEQAIEQAIKDTFTIKDSKANEVEVFNVNDQNPAMSGLLSQHDASLSSVADISKSGCYFMIVLAFAQLTAGKNLTAEQYLQIWNSATEDEILGEESYVKDSGALASMTLKMLGREDIDLAFGWEPKTGTLIGHRISVPYKNGSHFLLGDASGDALYNPGNTDSSDRTLRKVYVYAKN